MVENEMVHTIERGGVGGAVGTPAEKSHDLAESKLYRRAIREGWPVDAEMRQLIVDKMRRTIETDSIDMVTAKGEVVPVDNGRNQIAAARVIIEADKMNQADEHLQEKYDRIDTGKGTEAIVPVKYIEGVDGNAL